MSAKNHDAALIIIGNEILSGRTQDANTSWLAESLNEAGVTLAEVRIVRDVEAEIIAAVNDVRARYRYVFTTGGIGPTHDDITAQSVARAFGVELAVSEAAYQCLLDYYKDPAEITPPRLKMAMVPKGARLIANPVSGAPGFQMDNVYVMAGVPRIMQAMFDSIRGELDGGAPVVSATVACDLAESVIAADLSAIQDQWPQTDIGSYPNYRGGVLGLSVVIRTREAEILKQVRDEVVAMITRLGGTPTAITAVPRG